MKSAMFLVILATLAACTGPETTPTSPTAVTSGTAGASPSSTTTAPPPGMPAEPSGANPISVYAPDEMGSYPVIVTVHGGSWVGGDPATMSALADDLGSEAVVFNVTYRTLGQGGRFPGIVDDVACDVVSAVGQASAYTTTPEDVYLVGHSAGAHLAALVAFAPDVFTCDGRMADAKGFVGLAGPYDVTRLPLLNAMFGATLEEAPEVWAEGNPLTYVGGVGDLPILLVHGTEDLVVPVSFSDELAQDLEEFGADVQLIELPGVDHSGVRDPSIVGDLIADFVDQHRATPTS